MIGNLADTISRIGLSANQGAHVVGGNTSNMAKDLADAFQGWKGAKTRQAYIDQLTNEHPEDAAKIAQDPEAYAKMLEDNANAERDQQYKLDILGKQFENALALEDKRNANAVGLAKLAAELKGNQTTGMQNIEYLKTLGYSPEEAAALYYGGQNPNLMLSGVGKKGTEAYDSAIGKDIAEKEIKYKDALREKSSFDNTANRLEELLPEAELDTLIKRYTPTMAFGSNVQQARQEITNILGGLRLDQMQYLKGAISDKEQQFLSDITSGDIKKYTPDQIKGTLNSIKRKMNSEVDKYKPQSILPTDEDAWGGI